MKEGRKINKKKEEKKANEQGKKGGRSEVGAV